jgi:hypothetical protein
MELLRFAAESFWNLFVIMVILCTLGGFTVAIFAIVAELLATAFKKRKNDQ